MDSDPRQETKFRLQEQLLDLIEGDDALLLDLQRLDPWRRFPLRFSRQGAAVTLIFALNISCILVEVGIYV